MTIKPRWTIRALAATNHLGKEFYILPDGRSICETSSSSFGPTIHLVPLPVSSQFLDVIEAVFSGMKNAVIHHSDYQSEDEMKAAISRHFVERNGYFRDDPKRAGKKIWDI